MATKGILGAPTEEGPITLAAETEARGQPSRPAAGERDNRSPPLSTDVQTAIDVLGRRNVFQDSLLGRRLNLAHTDLRRLDLAGRVAQFHEVRLEGANLQYAELSEAIFYRASLAGADLQHARLVYAQLEHAWLVDAKLQHAELGGAWLRHAQLIRANLFGADLREASLQYAVLDGAKLHGADLGVAAHHDAALVGADHQPLKGARYDAHTTWPEDFDPQAAGAVGIGIGPAPHAVASDSQAGT